MNVAQCQAVLVRLADHFPFWGAKLSDERIANLAEDWAMVLADLEPREVSAALATLLSQKREFPPGVGEVNEAARGLIAKAQGEIEIAAAEAWQRVTRAVVSDGYGAMWDASLKARLTPAEIQTGEAIGLRRIRNRLEEDAGTDFAQFRDTFNAISKRATVERNMPPMVHNVIAALAAAWDMKRLAAPAGGDK